ncbi:hypothetical protein RHMOL_Rhmol12G0091100 [Rhododendron molle]|uniref:Uncharacterized protein n=1 Tax=Rhododendron molle TaxID=49168 RepID=A0ACC0LFV9_RHOML|nr:hypothetical protein RHMOL_Rhmol12G0091100 [Rhododendron molle]
MEWSAVVTSTILPCTLAEFDSYMRWPVDTHKTSFYLNTSLTQGVTMVRILTQAQREDCHHLEEKYGREKILRVVRMQSK